LTADEFENRGGRTFSGLRVLLHHEPRRYPWELRRVGLSGKAFLAPGGCNAARP